jgi:hypothetical protein
MYKPQAYVEYNEVKEEGYSYVELEIVWDEAVVVY